MRIEAIHGFEKIGDVVSMVDTVDMEIVRGLGMRDVVSVGSSCVESGAGSLRRGLMYASQEEDFREDPEETEDESSTLFGSRVDVGGPDAICSEDLDSDGIEGVMKRRKKR